MKIIIIAAVAENNVIGRDNKLPWHIPEDLKLFKSITDGNTVLMGGTTYESLGKPLPNRHNVVVSHSMHPTEGIDICRSLHEGLEKAKSYGKDIYIIGGASIYKQTLPLADNMYLSHIKMHADGDTHFPEFSKDEWEVEESKLYTDFEFVKWRRKNANNI
ncbi:dihydrofolate reductase [Nanoarchaeota archaeon]